MEVIKALDGEDPWSNGGTTTRHESLISWSPPPANWILLNRDDASKGNLGPAGGVGIFRGPRGEWICAFAENMGTCSSVWAEMKVVLRGAKIARECRFSKVWVQSDSMLTAGILKGYW